MDKMRYKVRLTCVGGVLLSHEKENKALRWLGDQRMKPPFSWDYTIINNPWMFCSIPMKQIRILLGWRSNKTEFLKRSLPNGPSQTLRCVWSQEYLKTLPDELLGALESCHRIVRANFGGGSSQHFWEDMFTFNFFGGKNETTQRQETYFVKLGWNYHLACFCFQVSGVEMNCLMGLEMYHFVYQVWYCSSLS